MFRSIDKSPTSPPPSPSLEKQTKLGTKIQYDSDGKVISSTYLTQSDIPLLPISKIEDLQASLDALEALATTAELPSGILNDILYYDGTNWVAGDQSEIFNALSLGSAATYDASYFLSSESDPIFQASPAATITESDIDGWVVGPASATDRSIPTYDGTTGKLIRGNPAVTIDSSSKLLINTSGFYQIGITGTGPYAAINMSNSATATVFIGMTAIGGQLVFTENIAPSSTYTSRNKLEFSNRHSTAHTTNNVLGSIIFKGSSGSSEVTGARISSIAEGAFTGSSAPSALSLFTSASASITPTERLKISSTGETQLRGGSGLRIYDSDNTNYVALLPAATGSLTSNLSFTLPTSHGTAGYPLTNNGSGTLSFAALGVSAGGTGATTFTNNRVLTGNGTSAIVDEANLTFDGTILTLTGELSESATGSYSTAKSFINQTGTLTSTANSLTHSGIRSGITFTNDGTVTGNNYNAGNFNAAISGSTAADAVTGITGSVSNSSANVADLYAMKFNLTESYASGDLTDRIGTDVTTTYSGATDHHTGHGFRSTITTSSTGRWNTAYGGFIQAFNGTTAYGLDLLTTHNLGTGNTAFGARVRNTVSGAGVVASNVYGIQLIPSATSGGAITTYYGIINNSTPPATTNYFLYNPQSYRNYLNGSVAIGVDVTTAKLFVRGAGNTSSTYSIFAENSSGTDYFKLNDAGQLYLGSSTPNAAAIFQADSTTQGFLPPRMTTAQRDAIATPVAGLMIYNTTTNKLNIYTTTWEAVTSA